MNFKYVNYLTLVLWITMNIPALTAQSFFDNNNRNIPGTTAGYYCTNATVSTANVPLSGLIGDNYIIDSVSISITHQDPDDLNISLISPRGKILNLSYRNGNSTDNAYDATIFTDLGGDIENTAPPFNGRFRPQGGTLNGRFAGDLITGAWRLEVCDINGGPVQGVVSDFGIYFTQVSAADVNPVYEVNVSSTQFINVNLNEDCEHLLTYNQVLNGDLDEDGDGNIPPNDAFMIVVNDENPCNGPIIDGCGTYDYWVSMPAINPTIQRGFMGCTGGTNILQGNVIPHPASQTATVQVTPSSITLTANATQANRGTVEAFAAYEFPQSGQVGFRVSTSSNDVFDVAIVSFDGTVTQVGLFATSEEFIQAQPLDVQTGDILQFTVSNLTNGPAAPGTATAIISNFFFQPTVPNVPVTNFLPLGGFVTAADATPVQFTTLPTSPVNLFTSQLSDVLTTSMAANISRSYTVDGNGLGGPNVILNSTLNPTLRARIELGGGFPIVYDGCSDIQITVADQITSAGNCQNIVVTRTFIAREISGCTSPEGPNEPVRASYQIIFRRPTLADVIPPMSVVEVDCDDFSGPGNPAALVQNFPALSTINGNIFLNQTVDNIGATFTDGPRINTCANTYKFVRTYTVIDWCNVDVALTFNQLIKVGDFGAPMITAPTQDLNFDGIPDGGPLLFSTNAVGCTAFIDITSGVGVNDDCSDNNTVTLVGYIFPDGDFDAIPFGPFNSTTVARDIPIGNHIIQYIANDICGNADTLNVEITVGDFSAPVAICEDGLNISLGGNGTAILMAVNVNEASYDDCSGNNLLYEIVRVDANNNPLGNYASSVTLNCTDLGTIRVALRVTDDGNMNGIFEPGIDNSNRCFATILVEDLGAPVCLPPSSFALTCSDLSGTFPEDLEVAFTNDMVGTINLLNSLFGNATGIDNCPGSVVTQTVVDQRNGCGIGLIRRSFGVRDAQGFTSFSNCNQTISIVGSFDYSITFPADQANMNCVEPDYNDVSIIAGNCNTITINTQIDTFQTSSDGCYLLRITYEIIDLCEMGTGGAPYVIPRDADQDGILGEQVILRVTPGASTASISDDVAVLDNDLNRTNGFINELDSGDGGLVNGSSTAGYGQDPSRGAFIYQQFITVIDNTGPSVVIDETNNQARDIDGNCQADLNVQFSISDECSMRDVTLRADVDLYVNDQNNDGIITSLEFIPNRTINLNDLTSIGEGDFSAFLRDLPIGRHAIRVRASDGCGNTNADIFVFDAVDATGPAISCINGLTATLSATEDGGGIATITARTFVVDIDNINDCSGAVTYAVYRLSTATAPNFTPTSANQILTVTCADLGMLPVRIYAFDPNGNNSFCETTLLVQVFNQTICSPVPDPNTPRGVIAGTIMTAFEQEKEGVEINIAAQLMGDFTTFTSNDGTYIVEHLMEGDDFTIQPHFNPAIDLAEVSTGDLILMSRHILGQALFNSPYQYVAADVNNDRRINVVDMIAIRRVILGLTQDFGQSNSWRFVSADHNFNSLPENWLESTLMEVYNVNDLEGRMLSADFTAIEMGNVSAATAAGNLIEPANGRSDFALTVPLLSLEENGFYEVPFHQPAELLGFQTTVQLQPGLELVEIVYGTAGEGDFNLNYVANGLIGIAHVSTQRENEPVFTLKLRATISGKLDELLLLNDRIVTSESYTQEANYPATAHLGLDFIEANQVEISNVIAGFELAQNYPNPFQRETRIDYTLPVATDVTLVVRDLQGRVIMTRKVEGLAGSNHFIVQRDELKGAGGLLSYTVATNAATLTRKMLVTH